MRSTLIMRRILDTKCVRDYLNKVMIEQCQNVTPSERENILKLNFFSFDGTLGTWNTAPVDLELKDDAKPV